MPKPFSVACPNCDARLKIQNPKAIGKKVRCPNCETPFTVKSPRATAPPRDDFEDYDDYDDDYEDYDEDDFGPPQRRSRREGSSRSARGPSRRSARGSKPRGRKRKSNNKLSLIIGAVVLGLCLLVGFGFLIYALLGGSAVDYAWLPPDSEMVIAVDVDDVWNSGFVRRLKNGENGAAFERQLEQIEKQLKDYGFEEGESIDEIDSFTAGFEDSDRKKGLAVIRKKSPWNKDAIIEKERLKEESRDGTTYYKSFRQACFFPDENTLVLGDTDIIEAAIDRGPKSNIAEKFSFLPKGQIVVGFMPKNREKFSREMAIPPMVSLVLGAKDYIKQINEGLQTVQGGALSAKIGGGIEVDLLAKCSSAEAAGKLAGGINEGLTDLRTSFFEEKREAVSQASERDQQSFQLGESVFNTISASQSGETVTLSLEVSSSVIDQAEQFDRESGRGGGPSPLPGLDFEKFFGGGGRRPNPRPGF